jgi:RNA polymerase-binding transcription factor DksA
MSVDPEEARKRVLEEKERVEGLIHNLKDELGDGSENDQLSELSDYDQHPADTASETFEREKETSILERLENELAEIQAALERIDAGTYGVDEVTGESIAPERLEAVPTARTNVENESKLEDDSRLRRGAAGDPEEY